MLCSREVHYFATTTGTTGKPKLIPVTNDLSSSTKLTLSSIMYYCMKRAAGLDLQRVVVLYFSARTKLLPGGRRCGPVSQFMRKYPAFLVAPADVFDLSDEQVAYHVLAVFALQEPEVGRMETLLATVVYGFWLYIEKHWQTICEDIERGSLSLEFLNEKLDRSSSESAASNMNLLLKISTQLTPNPRRAARLRREFQAGFHNICKRVWPNMTSVRMLNTGGFAHAAGILRDVYMPGVAQLSFLHVSSEGFVGIDVSCIPSAGTYTAATQMTFFEFIREADSGEEQPDTLLADQLKVGESYEVVLTTDRGLYRYRMGDIVKVERFYNQCPVFSFQYRSVVSTCTYKSTRNSRIESSNQCPVNANTMFLLVESGKL